MVAAGILDEQLRAGIEYPIWSLVHGLAVLTGQGPLRDLPESARLHLEKRIAMFTEQALA